MQEVTKRWFGEVYARPPMSSLLGGTLIQQLTEEEWYKREALMLNFDPPHIALLLPRDTSEAHIWLRQP